MTQKNTQAMHSVWESTGLPCLNTEFTISVSFLKTITGFSSNFKDIALYAKSEASKCKDPYPNEIPFRDRMTLNEEDNKFNIIKKDL